jgi:hypothetical protein
LCRVLFYFYFVFLYKLVQCAHVYCSGHCALGLIGYGNLTAGCATLWIFTLKLHRAKPSLLNLVHEAANMTNFESRLKVSTPNVQCTVKNG